MCLARLLTKISKEETFEENDWIDAISLAFAACQWLADNAEVEIVRENSQIYIQPKTLKKRGQTKE